MSGRRMPDWKIAPADFAVPYAAPNVVKTMEHAQPIAPKKDCPYVIRSGFFFGKGLHTAYMGLRNIMSVESQ